MIRKLLLCLALLCSLQANAQNTLVFLRNREVIGHRVGGEIWVKPEELQRLLTERELRRVKVGSGESPTVEVDGTSIGVSGPGIPIVALAQAIGFSKHLANGMLDLVPPVDPGQPAHTEQVDSSRRSEYRVAGERLDQILKFSHKSDDPEGQARVNRIGQRVAACCPLAKLDWIFVLVDMNMPNAACCGEGHVLVTRALLDLGVSDDELAGVLGHEIAHGVRRHPFRRVELLRDIRQLLADYTRLQREVNEESGTSHYDVDLRNRVEGYQRRRDNLQYRFDHEIFYSQLDEEEADVLGLRYAVAAGYSADGLGNCLEKLERAAVELFGSAILQDDMSHPSTRRRLEILRLARSNGKF